MFTPIRSGRLVSVTTSSVVLLPSVGHLYRLANYPVVVHVSLHPEKLPDYSAITSIRNAGWTFLQSASIEEAQDMALTAHSLAVRSGKGVIHFFSPAAPSYDGPITREDVDVVRDILNLDNVRRFQSTHTPGSSIYVDDGRVVWHRSSQSLQREQMVSAALLWLQRCLRIPCLNIPKSQASRAQQARRLRYPQQQPSSPTRPSCCQKISTTMSRAYGPG